VKIDNPKENFDEEANLKMLNSTEYLSAYEEAVSRLKLAKISLLTKFQLVRAAYVSSFSFHDSIQSQDQQLPSIDENEEDKDESVQQISTDWTLDPTYDSILNLVMIEDKHPTKLASYNDKMAAQFQADSSKLSSDNINPRGSYLGRLFIVQGTMCNLNSVFRAKPTTYSFSHFVYSNITFIPVYIVESFQELHRLFIALYYLYTRDIWFLFSSSVPDRKYHEKRTAMLENWKIIRPYIQPMKISAAITITCLLVVSSDVVIRQENSSSSFLIGVQRIEGTVFGALFASGVFILLGCSEQSGVCTNSFKIPLLVIWIFLCCCFKDGPRRGYAAAVAALTPLVILLLPSNTDANTAWRR
jgi:hypothetical protein